MTKNAHDLYVLQSNSYINMSTVSTNLGTTTLEHDDVGDAAIHVSFESYAPSVDDTEISFSCPSLASTPKELADPLPHGNSKEHIFAKLINLWGTYDPV